MTLYNKKPGVMQFFIPTTRWQLDTMNNVYISEPLVHSLVHQYMLNQKEWICMCFHPNISLCSFSPVLHFPVQSHRRFMPKSWTEWWSTHPTWVKQPGPSSVSCAGEWVYRKTSWCFVTRISHRWSEHAAVDHRTAWNKTSRTNGFVRDHSDSGCIQY